MMTGGLPPGGRAQSLNVTEARTPIIGAEGDNIAAAAKVLRSGGLVAFATETVYGLGADATSDAAVARIFAAKERPDFNPLIVHVRDRAAAEREAVFDDRARALADAFWPGPLSLVLPRRPDSRISLLVSAGLETLALRAPDHDVAAGLMEAAQCPIAAPSANRSGEPSPTTAQHVVDSLDGRVDMILDGGPCPVGLESTVVDLGAGAAVLLRPGGLAAEEIEAVVGALATARDEDSAAPKSPGMLLRHYAPRATLRLNAGAARAGEALLAFGPGAPPQDGAVRNLSATGDLTEAAANFFAMLRELDRPGVAAIAVMPVPEEGLGLAINDRLRRAVAGRE